MLHFELPLPLESLKLCPAGMGLAVGMIFVDLIENGIRFLWHFGRDELNFGSKKTHG